MAVLASVVAALGVAGLAFAKPLQNTQLPRIETIESTVSVEFSKATKTTQQSLPSVAVTTAPDLAALQKGQRDAMNTDLNSPVPTTAAIVMHANANIAQHMTVTVINSNGGFLSTAHGRDRHAPTPMGSVGDGIMEHGQTAVFRVRNGWSGRLAVNDAKFRVPVGDESLIEGSYVDQGQGRPQGDINVSYVDGFTAPIVCWCNENMAFTGCNADLHKLNKCMNPNGQGSCKNSNRGVPGITKPNEFFRPCHFPGGAYTFDADDKANNLNQGCPTEQFTCCIGSKCPKNPSQH